MDNRDRWWRNKCKIYAQKLDWELDKIQRPGKSRDQIASVLYGLIKASKLPYDMDAHEHLVKLDDDVHVKKTLNGKPFTTKAMKLISKATT